jgi:hypothetical protein
MANWWSGGIPAFTMIGPTARLSASKKPLKNKRYDAAAAGRKGK